MWRIIVDTAIAMLKGVPLAATEYYQYFSIYPHNVPLTVYIMCIFKIADILGIAESNYIVLLQLINCFLLDFALFQMFSILNRKYGIEKALTFGVLCFLNPLIYYYPVFFYTQVLSIPLFVLLITIFFKLIDARSNKQRLFYGFCYGIVLFFGWKIRFFTLITLIACAMFLLFQNSMRKLSYRSIVTAFLSILISFTLCLGANELLMTKYTVHTEKTQAFPIHHWIMMGLQGDGTFSYLDEDFTSAFPGKDSRIEENSRVIKERLEGLGLSGLLKLWGRKMAITWSDGYDDYSANLTLVDQYGTLNDYLYGYRSEYLVGYLHIYNASLWLLLTFCAVNLLQKKHSDFIYTVCITILGGIMFHLIWEAGEAFSMPFSLLIMGGAAAGMSSFSELTLQSLNKKSRVFVVSSIAVGFLLCVISICPALVSTQVAAEETASIQNLVGGNYLYLESGDTIIQTVQASRDFNTVTVRYKYYEESEGEVTAYLRVYDESGVCLTEQKMPMQSAVTLIDFSLPTVHPEGTQNYTIELSAVTVPEDSRIGVTAYNTENWDVYPKGSASHNGIEITNADIYFELTNNCKGTLLF